jgi:hypothetical protein
MCSKPNRPKQEQRRVEKKKKKETPEDAQRQGTKNKGESTER